MQYVDKDLIDKWWGQELNMSTLGNVLRYASEKDFTDICIPYKDYVEIILNSGLFEHHKGSKDSKGRPTVMVCGITITALSREEANKYRILK